MAHLSNLEGVSMEGKLPEVRLANTPFSVVSPYEPAGDQPQAIHNLAQGVQAGLRYQTLLGVTGSGKTFTMAKLIEAVQKPTLDSIGMHNVERHDATLTRYAVRGLEAIDGVTVVGDHSQLQIPLSKKMLR